MIPPFKRSAFAPHPFRTTKISETRRTLIGLALAVTFIVSRQASAAGPAPIDLRSTAHFTILATSTTTTTGGGIINGDVGLYPAGSQGIPPAQINGTIYNGDPIAAQAELDLNAAYNAASPAALPGGSNVGAELGTLTLPGGVYQSPSGAYGINGDLTLFGGPNDVWVFQMASTLTVGVGSRVLLTGGAQARNVFWQVGSSATLNSSSIFEGTIMVYASITMNSSSTLDGRALAQNGAVTYNGSGGSLPTPAAPVFTNIVVTNISSVTLVLNTTPYFLLTLQTSTNLPFPNWTTIATNTPVTNVWTFIDTNAVNAVTERFYQAFITSP
jgi:type VI secretion system secreted protein VgrG